jgi:Fe-S cluster assembly iron-binding protein IscA
MHMLTLTHPAATMLSDVRSQQGIPDDALLRIAPAADGEQGIALGFVDEPMEGDQTADVHGLAFCVAPEVAEALSGAKIDVQNADVDSAGAAQLVIVPAD